MPIPEQPDQSGLAGLDADLAAMAVGASPSIGLAQEPVPVSSPAPPAPRRVLRIVTGPVAGPATRTRTAQTALGVAEPAEEEESEPVANGRKRRHNVHKKRT